MVFDLLKFPSKMSDLHLFPEQNQPKTVPPMFKCDICLYSFRSSTELNVHVLAHFQQIACTICQQDLILIGNIWYGPHEHANHVQHMIQDTVEKSDLNAIVDEEEDRNVAVILPDFVEIPSNDNVNVFQKENDTPFLGLIHPKSVKNEIGLNIDPIPGDSHDFHTDETLTQSKQCKVAALTTQVTKDDSESRRSTRKNKIAVLNEENEVTSDDIEMKETNSDENSIEDTTEDKDDDDYRESNDDDDNNSDDDDDDYKNDEENNSDEEKSDAESKKPGKSARKVCNICSKEFVCGTAFKYHMNVHLGIKPFACDICDRAYTDKRKLNTHKKTHEPMDDADDYIEMRPDQAICLSKEQLRRLTCPICKKKFSKRKGLKDHVDVHNRAKFMCKFCGKAFRDVNNYTRHRITVHKNEPKTENVDSFEIGVRNLGDNPADFAQSAVDWVCEYCNMDFEFELRLAKHIIREHSDERSEHVCNICQSTFKKPNELLTHTKNHPESTQHKCTYDGCGQGFAYKASLGVHMNKHQRVNNRIERKTQDQLTELAKQHAEMIMNAKKSTDQEKTLKCTICDKQFGARTNLMTHIQYVHSNNDWIKCAVDGCEKIFKSTSGVLSHMQNVHPEHVKKCEDCGRSFYSEEKFAEHRIKHDKSRHLFDCKLCGKRFSEKFRLRSHLTQHDKDVECNLCHEKFSNVRIMMAHRERHGQKFIINCRFKDCNQSFGTRKEFREHSSQHTYEKRKKFICNYCGKAMASMSYLRGHINTHLGATPYKCNVCDKAFSKDGSLRRHKLIHTGEKPYRCEIENCNAAYRDMIDLKRHKFSAHNIYHKKHICTICSKVFPERKLLTKHTTSAHGKVDLDPKTPNDQ